MAWDTTTRHLRAASAVFFCDDAGDAAFFPASSPHTHTFARMRDVPRNNNAHLLPTWRRIWKCLYACSLWEKGSPVSLYDEGGRKEGGEGGKEGCVSLSLCFSGKKKEENSLGRKRMALEKEGRRLGSLFLSVLTLSLSEGLSLSLEGKREERKRKEGRKEGDDLSLSLLIGL